MSEPREPAEHEVGAALDARTPERDPASARTFGLALAEESRRRGVVGRPPDLWIRVSMLGGLGAALLGGALLLAFG
jgi:hypothetical protein